MTQQQAVLDAMQYLYGETAYTVHHLNYKLVGFRRGSFKVSAVGDTWEEAMALLERKAIQ